MSADALQLTFGNRGAPVAPPARLRATRLAFGLTEDELASMLGIPAVRITCIERGAEALDDETLSAMARHLSVAPTFLTREPLVFTGRFRALSSMPPVARYRIIALCEIVCDLLAELHLSEVPAFNCGTSSSDPVRAAQEFRQRARVAPGPIKRLMPLVEDEGVAVTICADVPTQMSGVSVWAAERPLVMLSAGLRDGTRQRFTLAHELGHLILHRDATAPDQELEEEADRFAAELLMPATEIGTDLPRQPNWTQLVRLRDLWGVSVTALLRRALDLQVMPVSAYRYGIIRFSASRWLESHRLTPHPIEVPSLFERILANTTIDDLASSLGASSALLHAVVGFYPGDDCPAT